MQEDVLYPTSSERLIAKPESRVKKETTRKHEYEKERPILLGLLDYLENQIESYRSVESVRTDNMDLFRQDVAVNKKLVEILTREKQAIERLARMYEKTQD